MGRQREHYSYVVASDDRVKNFSSYIAVAGPELSKLASEAST